jgi:hypothetical protein
MSSGNDRSRVVGVFLSHSYTAPAVNLFFYELNATSATISFRVDRGKFSTSTTRLERMIRDSDAFVGVWPIPDDPDASWEQDALAKQARYFRLELDMAIRARKPGIVFVDQRYGRLLQTPSDIERLTYDAQEISLKGSSPSWSRMQAQAERFWGGFEPQSRARFEDGRVGMLLGSYDDFDAVSVVEEEVTVQGFEPVRLPVGLTIACLNEVRRCDWVIADVTDPKIEALTAFLFGQFTPVVRVRRANGDTAANEDDTTGSPIENVLFGDLTVGYRKDVTRWATAAELQAGLGERLRVIAQRAVLIGDRAAATAYFSSAAKRKEPVFLSYAGEDAAIGEQFGDVLREHFQEVFDYRDDVSLTIGEYWQDEIARKLSASVIGVVLLSRHYTESGYCMDECRNLYDGFMGRGAKLLPVKLDDGDPPQFLSQVQYQRMRGRTPAEIVERFASELGPD